MRRWQALVSLGDDELAGFDVAEVNLACAQGLPGCEAINVDGCLRTLDWWAECVGTATNRYAANFQAQPSSYENSWAYFRTLVLITVLQRDLGVRYNPAKIPNEAPLEPADVFVHGVIQGAGGTCASMPVIWAAVGRRLGYPIKLVSAKSHLFARWDEPAERFNIEASGKGLTCPPDDYYREGRYAVTPKVEELGCLLQSQSPREELAGFLAQRGHCWLDAGRHREAVKTFAWASAIAPENKFHACSMVDTLDLWSKTLKSKIPATSPRLTIQFPPSQFVNMPRSIEQQMMATEILEDLLDNEELKVRLAGPHPPGHVFVQYPSAQLWRI